MSVSDHIATASDKAFAGRVMLLSLKVAHKVTGETPGTPNRAERLRYAAMVISGDEKPQLVAAHIIAATPAIAALIDRDRPKLGANVPDNDLEAAITALWAVRSKAYAQMHPPMPMPPAAPQGDD